MEQPSDRVQLRVFRMPVFLLLGGQTPLETGDEIALHEACVYSRFVIDQSPQRQATLQRPKGGATLLVLEEAFLSHIELDPIFAQVLLEFFGQLDILGIACGNDDLALPLELLSVVDNREGSDPQAGNNYRDYARPGKIQ